MNGDNIFSILGLFLVSFISLGLCVKCTRKNNIPDIQEFFQGPHILRKMQKEKISIQQNPIGGFFLFGTGIISGGSSSQINTVTFSWLNNNSEYMITTLPIEKIRVVLDNPKHCYVVFQWKDFYAFDFNSYINNLNYVQIHCNAKDWPMNITLPLN